VAGIRQRSQPETPAYLGMQGALYIFWLGIAVACLLVPAPGHATDKLETYELQQRKADELIPVIRPLLPPGSAINGQAYTLVVRGNDAAHATVRQILRKLDGKLRNLRISVRFSAPVGTHSEASGVRIRLHTGNDSAQLNAEAGKTPSRRGATIDIQGKDVSVRAGHEQTDRTAIEDSDYHVRVLEGREAFIQTGSSIPYRSQTIYPGGARQSSIQFHDARSGFYVRPRLNGEQVLLDILPHQQQPARHGRIDTQQVQTTVSGMLGQWIELGGVSTTRQHNSSQALHSRTDTFNKNTSIFVRVEIIQ
jgi:type II secretory pathway component GspD/PulD (secretin)